MKAAPRNLRGAAFLFICRSPRLLDPPEAKWALAKYFPGEMNVTPLDARPTLIAAYLPRIACPIGSPR
jgi:hypothetical protein